MSLDIDELNALRDVCAYPSLQTSERYIEGGRTIIMSRSPCEQLETTMQRGIFGVNILFAWLFIDQFIPRPLLTKAELFVQWCICVL